MADNIKQGDRVRVVKIAMSYGDYKIGSTAKVLGVDPDGHGYRVEWEQDHYEHAPELNQARCRFLYPDEVELIPEGEES